LDFTLIDSQPCNFEHLTSTPKVAQFVSTSSSGTQSLVHHDAATQTDLQTTETQCQTSAAFFSRTIGTQTSQSQENSQTTSTRTEEDNDFDIIDVEDTLPIDYDDTDLPPLPLPWISDQPKPTIKKSATKSPRSDFTPAQAPTSHTVSSPAPTKPRQKKTVLIVGDSIPKNLNGRRRMSRMHRVINRCLPGSSLSLWSKILPAMIEEEQPSFIIIHCGTNDMHSRTTSDCISLLCDVIGAIPVGIEIAVSSLTTQEHSRRRKWICDYNTRLSVLCQSNAWTYINNNNITLVNLTEDKLHLNKQGTSILARNYISVIKTTGTCNVSFRVTANRTVK
jgi:lysophospholipase L1-like esterase